MKPKAVIQQAQIDAALRERHSPAVQKKLDTARVAIAGLGGLGSHVAFALARIGVGHLHLIDFDRVDIANLNRQQYLLHHVGMFKTDALKEELLDINPYLDIHTDCIRVTEENLLELFAQEDIVCEAFDTPEAKAMLVNGILESFSDTFLVAASGMAGYGDSNRIQTRRITDHFYLCGDGSAEPGPGYGLMAPRVMLCAAHQANLIVQYICKTKKGEG